MDYTKQPKMGYSFIQFDFNLKIKKFSVDVSNHANKKKALITDAIGQIQFVLLVRQYPLFLGFKHLPVKRGLDLAVGVNF